MNIKHFFLFIILTLLLLAVRFYYFYAAIPVFKDGQEVNIRTKIASEPQIEGKTQRFSIIVKSYRIFVSTAKFPLYRYGDRIDLKGQLKVSENDSRIFYNLSYPVIRKLDDKSNILNKFSLWVRKRTTEIFTQTFTPIQASLLLGIVFGIKQGMPDEFTFILSDAGVIHVIAASGMNVSMVSGALFSIFSSVLKRRTAIIASIMGIFLYVSIAGFEASIIRAAIMAAVSFSAGLFGKQKFSLYILFLTCIVMLFINPIWLYDIGFQLSFMATFGIIVFKPLLDKKINFIKLIKDDLNTTLSAQIFTLPILISNFGSVNLLSILVNICILWTVPILMVIGGISVIAGLFFTQLGQIIALFAYPLLIYFEYVVIWFDRFKIPIKIESSSWILWIGYYLILSASVIYAGDKGKVIRKNEK